jgi:gag-polypeptide of LTR copia-type
VSNIIRNKSISIFNYFHGIRAGLLTYESNPKTLPYSSSQQAMSTDQEDEKDPLSQSTTVTPSAYYDANPALKLTTELLNDNNYLSWSEAILLALGEKPC